MNDRGKCLATCIVLAVLLVLVGCGKKGLPFLPVQVIPLQVSKLQAQWDGQAVTLKGRAATVQEGGAEPNEVTGCFVYHAWYAPGKEPCKDCPVELKMFKKIEGHVLSGDAFQCQLSGVKKPGTHYFMVRLAGKGGSEGPSSNRAELVVE